MAIPLAERLRPRSFDQFFGQEHLLGEGKSLRKLIETERVPSMIFWGPPGVGKTSLALFIAEKLKRPYTLLSAVNSGVKDVREAIAKSKKQQFFDAPSPILFIDEIHRFSKSQQDALLHAVEKGIVTLIGATTENPSFEVIPALLSRCQLFILQALAVKDLDAMLLDAIKRDQELQSRSIQLNETDLLIRYSGGDARKLYNGLELIVNSASESTIIIDNDSTQEILSKNLSRYDKSGEQHYDIISAFIKSIRGSDPNGAVYWLARMLEGGEDIKFIGRRLIISASEDIGLANPNALLMATNGFQAAHTIGLPEARIILSQVAVYLACSPKGNSSYEAINKAIAAVRQFPNEPVPLHLRNAPTKLMKDIGYGKDYKYAHAYDTNFVEQEYLPEALSGTSFFTPSSDAERKYIEFMEEKWGKKYT
jgi:putative ATPase